MSQFVRLLRCVGLAVVGIVSLGIGVIEMHAPHTHSVSEDQLVAYSTPFYGAFGNAGSLPPPRSPLSSVVTATAVTSSGTGVLAVTADGHVVPSGSATSYGDASALNLYAPIVGIALTPDDHGYWLVASDGGVFSLGDAAFYGSMGGHPLNAPVVGIAATPTGHGYWLVAADGGIFTFGDAPFYGSMGGQHLNAG
ncbi:MAG: hypothetical protein ACP5PJ_03895, partial [Acidimicrobiales bacterium]